MKKMMMLLICSVSLHAVAQTAVGERIVMRETGSGKKHVFTLRNNVTFELQNDSSLYAEWKIERCSDSSLFVSNWRYKQNDCGYVQEGERVIREIKFRELRFIRFSSANGMTFIAPLLVLGSSASLAFSPELAKDSANHFNENNFRNILVTGAAVLAVSGIIEWRLHEKNINYDMREWTMSRKRRRI
jgi:hypothetical protein